MNHPFHSRLTLEPTKHFCLSLQISLSNGSSRERDVGRQSNNIFPLQHYFIFAKWRCCSPEQRLQVVKCWVRSWVANAVKDFSGAANSRGCLCCSSHPPLSHFHLRASCLVQASQQWLLQSQKEVLASPEDVCIFTTSPGWGKPLPLLQWLWWAESLSSSTEAKPEHQPAATAWYQSVTSTWSPFGRMRR